MDNAEKKSLSKEQFSVIKRAQSFSHAGRGLRIFFQGTHNAWIHAVFFIVAILFGIYFKISNLEWVMLVLAGGLVFCAEAFNSAIEIDINLTSPDYHPYARDTKDVAAGAALFAVLTALAVGLFIFGPRVLQLGG